MLKFELLHQERQWYLPLLARAKSILCRLFSTYLLQNLHWLHSHRIRERIQLPPQLRHMTSPLDHAQYDPIVDERLHIILDLCLPQEGRVQLADAVEVDQGMGSAVWEPDFNGFFREALSQYHLAEVLRSWDCLALDYAL